MEDDSDVSFSQARRSNSLDLSKRRPKIKEIMKRRLSTCFSPYEFHYSKEADLSYCSFDSFKEHQRE